MGAGCVTSDITRDACMLRGSFARRGYDWWWHSFTARNNNTGKEKAFFIAFFLCNPELAKSQPVLGQLPENAKAERLPSYLMVKAGYWGENARQIHRFFAWEDVTLHMDAPFSVEADDCIASETCLSGSVHVTEQEAQQHPEYMCQAGEMSWKLQVDKQIPFNVGYGAAKPFRDAGIFEMYWHAEGMKTQYSGTVMLDGESYTVYPQTSYGYADKNWGSGFTSPWVWLSSSHMVSRLTGMKLHNSVFDIGGGKPRICSVALDHKLLGVIYYEGTPYEFNFSKPWTHSRSRFACKETEKELIWHVRQTNETTIMDVQIRCPKKEMLLINYEEPNGQKRHNRLWNGGTGVGRIRLYHKTRIGRELIDDISVRNVGCEYGEFDSQESDPIG